jgi:enamine deaminase RidA (YjgF/YER057c/UK114 family)
MNQPCLPSPSPTTPQPQKLTTTSNPYEAQFQYHRAIRRGPFIFVSGTTSLDPNPPHSILQPNDASAQAKVAFLEGIAAVEALGGKKEDVCRVRMFVAEKEDSAGVGEVLRQVFGSVGVAGTMIVLGRDGGFVDGGMRVEVSTLA